MKKGILLTLTVMSVLALVIWFSCNPFQSAETGSKTNFNVLDASDAVRATGDNVAFGFASLNGGTTGGEGGVEYTVSTGAEMLALIKQKKDGDISVPLKMIVNGTITESNTGASKIDVKDVRDISIVGAGSGAEFNGIGIKCTRTGNVILQNLIIHHVTIGDKDCISIEGPADHIWVDHCTLYNDLDHDKDYYDGLLDAKKNSEYLTFSYNYLHDSYKTALVGSSDSDNYDRKITYAYNRFENCFSRLPLFRFGTGHILNNYYNNILDTGVNSRMGAQLRIEGNVFENSKDPIGFWYSDETGYWDVRDNVFNNCTGSQPTTSTCTFNPPYSYNLLGSGSTKSYVLSNAGAGNL